MMNTKYIYTFLMLSVLSGCYDNEQKITDEEVIDPPKFTISVEQTGKIIDENGGEVKRFTLDYNQKTYNTEERGFYHLNGSRVNKYGEKVTLTDASGQKTELGITAFENDINYSVLTIFTQRKKLQNNASEVLQIPINGDFKLESKPNTYASNGNVYTGSVLSSYVMPDLLNLNHIMGIPSIRLAKSAEGRRSFLNINQVVWADVKTSSGLNLSCNMVMKDLNNTWSKNNQKLWYFEANSGIWAEVMTSQGVEGDINFVYAKSGFYAIGDTQPGVYVEGQVVLGNQPAAQLGLVFKHGDQRQIMHTSSNGHWVGYFPADEILTIEFLSECGNIGSSNLKTTSTDSKNIILDISQYRASFSNINGTVKDCEGNLLDQSVITYHQASNNYYYLKQANFERLIPACDAATITLSVSDSDGKEASNQIIWDMESSVPTGSWFACNRAKNGFFNLIIDDQNKMYWNNTTFPNTDGRIGLKVTNSANPSAQINIFTPRNIVGLVEDNKLNILLNESDFKGNKYDLYCPSSTLGCGFETFKITHWNRDNDGIIRGYFEGRFWVKTLEPLTAGYKIIEGEFQIFE